MCGRTACTLDPDQTRRACAYTNRQGRRVRPRWKNPSSTSGKRGNTGTNNGKQRGTTQTGKQQQSEGQILRRKYYPSFNLTPTGISPVLVSAKHFDSDAASDDRQLAPMQWGLVPSWHKDGDHMSVAYKMNNCRREGMMEKRTFSRLAEKGQRCVVLVDGYYEWLTSKDGKKKQPYFIYFPQDAPIENLASKTSQSESEPEQPDCLPEDEVTEGSEWKGHRLVTMAGLFDCWYPPQGGEPLYSYTVITLASSESMSWLHHRMPAILDGDEAVKSWLDYGTVPIKKALELMNVEPSLTSHPVSMNVNNSRYKASDCIIPINLDKPVKETASSKLMSSWLSKGSTPKKETSVKKETGQETTPPVEQGSPLSKPRSSPRKQTAMTAWLSKANPELKVEAETEQDGPPSKKSKLF
ncbi:abasic site processing protein HMCES-like [Asterias rubens]|uniref:abasic site processing protein HMCES-like n=1 Tax=Asterias rubens TaxID=7604 RepID=UPI0014554C4E|nr:abasic site processing protein HMCES-like [Asterias rubens]